MQELTPEIPETYRILWHNSPLGRLNFLMLPADAVTKAFQKKKTERSK